jgi:hypothetical protein
MTRTFGHDETALKEEIYLRRYEEVSASLADQPIALLELGVHRGGSMRLWRDYFPRGTIAGLDLLPVEFEDDSGRIHIYQGSQTDETILDRIGAECAPDGFDIIIDDCSHIAELSRTSFTHLFDNHLKDGGWYVIEDWGTGYWPHWHDGAEYDGTNHTAGMVGFVKELVDLCAGRKGLSARSITDRMIVTWSQVFARKGCRS